MRVSITRPVKGGEAWGCDGGDRRWVSDGEERDGVLDRREKKMCSLGWCGGVRGWGDGE